MFALYLNVCIIYLDCERTSKSRIGDLFGGRKRAITKTRSRNSSNEAFCSPISLIVPSGHNCTSSPVGWISGRRYCFEARWVYLVLTMDCRAFVGLRLSRYSIFLSTIREKTVSIGTRRPEHNENESKQSINLPLLLWGKVGRGRLCCQFADKVSQWNVKCIKTAQTDPSRSRPMAEK